MDQPYINLMTTAIKALLSETIESNTVEGYLVALEELATICRVIFGDWYGAYLECPRWTSLQRAGHINNLPRKADYKLTVHLKTIQVNHKTNPESN